MSSGSGTATSDSGLLLIEATHRATLFEDFSSSCAHVLMLLLRLILIGHTCYPVCYSVPKVLEIHYSCSSQVGLITTYLSLYSSHVDRNHPNLCAALSFEMYKASLTFRISVMFCIEQKRELATVSQRLV